MNIIELKYNIFISIAVLLFRKSYKKANDCPVNDLALSVW